MTVTSLSHGRSAYLSCQRMRGLTCRCEISKSRVWDKVTEVSTLIILGTVPVVTEMGWSEVISGHPSSLEIAPFDRAHTSSS